MSDKYPLTQNEERFVAKLRELQSTAADSKKPRVLTVFVTDDTFSFFDGTPSGASKNDRKNK
jgi:hypothetical protein